MNLLQKYKKYSEYYPLCDEGRREMLAAAEEICADGRLSEEAHSFLRRLTSIADEAHFRVIESELKERPPQFGAFVYTLMIEEMERVYGEKAIPRDVFDATFYDMQNEHPWMDEGPNGFGMYGFDTILHLCGETFVLGRLRFEMWHYVEETPPQVRELGLKEGDCVLDVHVPAGLAGSRKKAGSVFRIRETATLPDIFREQGVSRFRECEKTENANPSGLAYANPAGLAEANPSGKLSRENCLDAFGRAKAFFPKHFGYDFKAFGCETWLFDPAFEKMLPPESNILMFRRLFTVYKTYEDYDGLDFIFNGITRENIKDAPRDTRLQRAVIEHMLAGGILQAGAGYRMA